MSTSVSSKGSKGSKGSMNVSNGRSKALTVGAGFLGLALASAPALADQGEQPGETARVAANKVPVVPTGFGVQLGGGVTSFSRQETRDRFGTGGYWDVRGVLGQRSYLGAELAYVGSARGASAPGLADDAALIANGAEAAVRANLPLAVGQLRLAPFVFGGVGWSYYQMVNQGSNVSIKEHVNALTIPFGTGISASYAGLTLDARFTYRPVFDDKLVPLPSGDRDHVDLQNWAAGLTLGFEI
jgi:hypothetical protein